MGNWLVYVSIPLFLLYFYLFQRTIGMLDEPEQRRFVTDAGQPRWHIALAGLALILLVALRNPYARGVPGVMNP
jgi:hypothetical protein